jgi:hypothetical protein
MKASGSAEQPVRHDNILYISMLVTVCDFNANENFFLGAEGTGEGGGWGLGLFYPLILYDFIHPPTALAIPVIQLYNFYL